MNPMLGHESTRARLWDALGRGALHHAYLFEGPQGVGKRLIATRLAMAANCTGDGPERPCGACPTCRQIAQGTHPDVIAVEPDLGKAARTIPVEAVRDVIRQTQYHRYGSRRRFVIVDPAEAMGESAANALLKTLEEPPDGTGFVLISHNASALLPTIRSRCQRVRFGAVPGDVLRAWLAERGVARPDEVARLAQGCPGRALQLADTGLTDREALRRDLLAALDGSLDEVYAFSQRLTQGSRQEWTPAVNDLLELIEDRLRDAAVHAAGAKVDLLDDPVGVERWAAMWPDGLERSSRALQDARDDLEVFVSGKSVLDALLATVRRELGVVSPSSG